MKPIEDFVKRFNANTDLHKKLVVKKQSRYYLLNENLRSLYTDDYFHVGTYLGKSKDGKFFPSLVLLSIIAEGKANRITVDEKTEWLFICGRDVFKRGVLGVEGSQRKGCYTLVVNQFGECLGFGRILRDLNEEQKDDTTIVKNILDIGDFLRREK